jgi:hypothetical protein
MPLTPSTNQVTGTILATGTLSSEFNLMGYNLVGIQALGASVNGTLGFMVSDKPDASGGVYRTLYGPTGTPVTITAPSGQFALSSDALTPLNGYQYIRVSSSAQTNGLALRLSLKSE